jgi:hypothetical protein
MNDGFMMAAFPRLPTVCHWGAGPGMAGMSDGLFFYALPK